MLEKFIETTAVTLSAIAVLTLVERFAARTRRVGATLAFNVCYAVALGALATLVQPLAAAESRWMKAVLDIPSVPLPQRGWGVLVSATVILLFEDLIFYWVHRAQHRFAWLWAMHSFHHSDDDLNAATAFRHFWLEKPAWMLVLFLPLGLVFRISPETAAMYGLLFQFFAYFPHMNLRLELGPLTRVVMGPQVHRIHHSIYREHFDTNFAGAFPVWDLVFGTYRGPAPGEFPPTGVPSLPGRPNVRQVLLWPLWARSAAAAQEDSTAPVGMAVASSATTQPRSS
jgi:sterol desaturase/sphingolipid hydroxylase (fatty acid hydroxylase superfamily)